MRKHTLTVTSQRQLTDTVFELELEAPQFEGFTPGQFAFLDLGGSYSLARPFSIADGSKGMCTIVYKRVGAGTEAMTSLQLGAKLTGMLPLGTGFEIDHLSTEMRVVLVGGGVGIPPLFALAKVLRGRGIDVCVVIGFATTSERFYEARFVELGCDVRVYTNEGSYGRKGLVTDGVTALLQEDAHDVLYTCGPHGMMKAVQALWKKEGYAALEGRMACGIGACLSCVQPLHDGDSKRICCDGPAFALQEVAL